MLPVSHGMDRLAALLLLNHPGTFSINAQKAF
jgi:hypothetical protein